MVTLAPAATAPRRPSTSRWKVVVGVALVAAAVGATVAWVRSDPEVEVSIDEDSDRTRPVPQAGLLLPAAPDDGKDSLMLPVTAEPSSGLVDGQEVVVTGSGFPPSTTVGVVMCAKEAGQAYGGHGVDACDLRGVTQTTSDSEGRAVASHPVRRLLQIAGQEVDCAESAERCMVAMGAINDYDQSGGALVSFDASKPLPPPPVVRADRTDGLSDGDEVAIRVEGLLRDSLFLVDMCSADLRVCIPLLDVPTDRDGVLAAEVRVWRLLPSQVSATNLDCAFEACVVRVNAWSPDERIPPLVPLRFDPGVPGRSAPVAALDRAGPFRAGDRFTVRLGDDAVATQGFTVMWCRGEDCTPVADGEGSEPVEVFVDAVMAERCVEGCTLHVQRWSDWSAGEPPALNTQPISISTVR